MCVIVRMKKKKKKEKEIASERCRRLLLFGSVVLFDVIFFSCTASRHMYESVELTKKKYTHLRESEWESEKKWQHSEYIFNTDFLFSSIFRICLNANYKKTNTEKQQQQKKNACNNWQRHRSTILVIKRDEIIDCLIWWNTSFFDCESNATI